MLEFFVCRGKKGLPATSGFTPNMTLGWYGLDPGEIHSNAFRLAVLTPDATMMSFREARRAMKPKRRIFATHEALGVASILMAAEDGVYNVEQDLKGRWHAWKTPATQPDKSDHIERQLAFESYG
jgi:hypothetical protein